jgi:hypothetical protein
VARSGAVATKTARATTINRQRDIGSSLRDGRMGASVDQMRIASAIARGGYAPQIAFEAGAAGQYPDR